MCGPTLGRFYTEVAHWAAREGLLLFAFLRVGGRPVAFDYMLRDSRSVYGLKIGYDDEYARWFPDAPPARYVAKLGFELPGVLVSIRMTAFVG